MTGVLRSEFRKMLTVRTTYLLAAGAVALGLATVFTSSGDVTEAARPLREQQSWFFTALLSRLLFVLLGIRVVTEEYRYGTITPTVLASASRLRLLVAKLLAASLGAVVLAALAQLALVAGAVVFWSQRGQALTVAAEDVHWMATMAAAAALYGALGAGLGFLFRQPVAVTVGAVLWLVLGEELLRLRIGEAIGYLPGYAGLALAAGPRAAETGQVVGAAALVAWTAGVALAAALLLHRRDVS